MKVSQRSTNADNLFALGLEKLTPELRNKVLTAKLKVRKSIIKSYGKDNSIPQFSIVSI